MKRELLCADCGAKSKWFFRGTRYPGEYVKHVDGTLRLSRPDGDIKINGNVIPWSGPCQCDFCGTGIERGSPAVARTMGMTGDYAAWESEYLTVPEGGA